MSKRSAMDVLMSSAKRMAAASPTGASPRVAQRRGFRDALLDYCLQPQKYGSERMLEYNDMLVVIWDLYPKAKRHLLIMPRQQIKNVYALGPEHLPLLDSIQNKAREVIEKVGQKRSFWVGFHAIPSMDQLHAHVISKDLVSPCLKTKVHFHSFTSSFLIPLDHVIHQLRTTGTFKYNVAELNSLLKAPLQCHLCAAQPFKKMPQLKAHLEAHEDKLSSSL